jgi:L-lactate dehydrogenase
MNSKINPGKHRKVVVVGAGSVGATYSYALAQSGLADDIVIIDKNEDLARGQVLDLAHGQPFFPAVNIRTGTITDYSDAQVIVITAGVAMKAGETRLELLRRNAIIIGTISEEIAAQESQGIMIIVSNPVDILTYIALKRSGWKRGRIIGSGTVLDSARFRYLLSRHCNVDVHNVHAYILGEHGDSEFAAWSMTHIAGINIDEYCPICGDCKDWKETRRNIEQQVRDSAYHIINYKGATHFAVGMALVRITSSILRSENSILTVSTLADGEFGINDICLSVPCIVSGAGATKIVESPLTKRELSALSGSAAILRKSLDSL